MTLAQSLDYMVRAQQMEDLARRLALALADEVVFHGESSAAEETMAVLAVARESLNLQEEFDNLDSLKANP